MENRILIGSLADWLAAGKLQSRWVLPALQQLTAGATPRASIPAMLESLADEKEVALSQLAKHLKEILHQEALRYREKQSLGQLIPDADQALLGDLPLDAFPEWCFCGEWPAAVRTAVEVIRDRDFLAPWREKVPRIFDVVDNACAEALDKVGSATVMGGDLIPRALLSSSGQTGNRVGWASDLVLRELEERLTAARQAMVEMMGPLLEGGLGTSSAALEENLLLQKLEARFLNSKVREEQRNILDSVCCWPTPQAIPTLRTICCQTWAQDRAASILTLRFGQPHRVAWSDWHEWLASQDHLWQKEQQSINNLVEVEPLGLLLVWYYQQPEPNPAVVDFIIERLVAHSGPRKASDVVQRWSRKMILTEEKILLAIATPPIPPPIPSGYRDVTATIPLVTAPEPRPALPKTMVPEAAIRTGPPLAKPLPKPALPQQPSVWENHIQPFFVENWYIVTGIAMVIIGSSLLAYYTWDKHWLLHYTIMPSLLAFFTWILATAGRWIEKKDRQFTGTAAILRGAAIGLLPINFMAVALLSSDEKVTQKTLPILVMVLFYLTFFGWGLKKWCAEVEPSLGKMLGGTLLLLNSLVAVGPVARTLSQISGQTLSGPTLLVYLSAGFYLGFLALAGAIVWFTQRILTREMSMERRVPWFVGATLAITYLQVFAWVHGYMRHLPNAHTYALLVIFIGWLVLFVERRALELLGSPQMHGAESFLGFALILLGLLMGFTEPHIRVASFVVAGGVWLFQAFSRRHPLHYWIALTFIALSVASLGLLPNYPGALLPFLGLLLALGFGAGRCIGLQRGQKDLAQACTGMQVVCLVLTTIVAALAQWHYRSEPLATAGWLSAVATLFVWRAMKDQNLSWLHAAMVVVALVLPYAGFADMAGRTAHHNTLVFGLSLVSFLWLGVTWLSRRPLLLQARSTILWFYGVLAVAAMLLRVAMEDMAPDPRWYLDYLDYIGPLLMMVVLVFTTYYSRSLIPAGMAIIIMVILFPELKANLQRTFTGIAWGSGLGSAINGLALAGLCFFLREWAFLKIPREGDRFMGKDLFPCCRYDHTLFTWPIMTAALFLIIKVDTWNVLRNWLGNGVQLKTATALALTGIAWTLIGIFHRRHRLAVNLVHLGWICVLAGISFGYWRLAQDPYWTWPVLATAFLVQGLYWLYRYGLEPDRPWVRDLLSESMRQVLLTGSAVLFVLVVISLIYGAELARMQWLCCFLTAQLVWHALVTRQKVFGTALFFLIWAVLLAGTAPGSGLLLERISLIQSLSPTLELILAVQLILILLEYPRSLYSRLEPLITPSFVIASGLTLLLGIAGLGDGSHWLLCSKVQQGMLWSAILLTARAHASGILLLLGMMLGYVMAHRELLAANVDPVAQLLLLATPWRLSLLGLIMLLVTQAGRWVHQQHQGLLTGPFARPFFTAPSGAWIYGPAAVLAGLAAVYHTFDPVLRESAPQLWAPYLGAVTSVLIARFWQRGHFYALAGMLLVLGNIHLVRVYGGEFLRQHGLSELHLIGLGSGFSLLQASLVRWRARTGAVIIPTNQVSLGLAGFILALLSVNYFTDSNLEKITSWRFVVSGLMAWLAGLYFRRAARKPGPGEEAHVDLCEALYHFGLVLALWCAALLIPWFRQPIFTLIALGLPVLYFYLRAELGTQAGQVEARRYRNSAAALGFVVLGLYCFKGIFHLVLFPGTPIGIRHYHYNAPIIMVLAVILLRLHGLGGTSWLAFYGGAALMGGSYFLLTALPGFSPFDFPIPSAWCAIGLGHFWTLVSYARSPLRTIIQRLANLDDPSWDSLRLWWVFCLLVATQGLTLWGLSDYQSDTFMAAPLLAGAASIFIHLGVIRQTAVYLIFAALELTCALHLDFLIPSYLPKDAVIWVILAIWLGCLIIHQFKAPWIRLKHLGPLALIFAGLTLAHVAYHHPSSYSGLWGVGFAALLAAWHPQKDRIAANAEEKVCAATLLWIPAWLVYFSQAPLLERGLAGAFLAWPVLASLMTLFVIGGFSRLYPEYLAAAYKAWPRSHFRLFDLTFSWLESVGKQIHLVVLWLTFLLAGGVLVFHYQVALAPREIVLLALLEAGLAAAWYYQGKVSETMIPYYMMQLSALACFASLRRHLMLTTGLWNYEYDVWISLVLSVGLAGAKQVLDLQPRKLRLPFLTTLCVLPGVALVWVMLHGLGSNMALLVVGLNSLMFAYLGKDDRESPFNIVALAGFVGFVLLAFWTKLELRAVHAYVIPVGFGILVLLQLFHPRIKPEVRNGIRLTTLLAMLGSTGYYALVDSSRPIAFNLTLVILCLLAMALGSFLRVRLYLTLGFAGLMVDLASILYKGLVHMERSQRMTVVGSLVLLIGAILIFGAIYYKTNKEKLDAWVDQCRRRLGEWE